MLVTYPALFYYDDTENVPYFVYIPDLETQTQGKTQAEALSMGAEAIGLYLADFIEKGEPLPQASDINSLSLEANNPFKNDEGFSFSYKREKSFISLAMVDLTEYLRQQEPIKKTLTIPKWADRLGRDMGLNFSQTLTEAIVEKKLQG